MSAVLARCAWIDVNDANVYTPEVSAHLNRVQRQLLSLISHFGSSSSALMKTSNSRDAQFILEAHVNTILFARNFISKGASSSRLIFAPSLTEAMSRGDGHGIGLFYKFFDLQFFDSRMFCLGEKSFCKITVIPLKANFRLFRHKP